MIAVHVDRVREPADFRHPLFRAEVAGGEIWHVRAPGIYAARDAFRTAILGELSPRERSATVVLFDC